MSDLEALRDSQVYSCISCFDENSYDFVGRGVELSNGVEAPFVRYLKRRQLVDVVFYSSDEVGGVMGDLERVRELLSEEGFDSRLSITSVDNADPIEEVSLGGDYYFDSGSDIGNVEDGLDWIIRPDFDDLELVYRKD